jgi:hypothetical protein
MNRLEKKIFKLLKKRPDEYFITPNGVKLYKLLPDNRLMKLVGPDFTAMNQNQIEQFIEETMFAKC